jgi:hypothetical protein
MKVFYITGASHSGSTLLAMMLNSHPEILSVGEMYKLQMKLGKNAETGTYWPCSCGSPSLWECDFWARVNSRIQATTSGSLADIDLLDCQIVQGDCAPNGVLFRTLAEISGKPIIADSSKRADRLSHLSKMKGIELYTIVLFRDPKGQVSSIRRKYGSGLFGSVFQYERVYKRLQRNLKTIPHTVVSYEDLVRHPERT